MTETGFVLTRAAWAMPISRNEMGSVTFVTTHVMGVTLLCPLWSALSAKRHHSSQTTRQVLLLRNHLCVLAVFQHQSVKA